MSAGIGQVVLLWARPESAPITPATPVAPQLNVGQPDRDLEGRSAGAGLTQLEVPYGRHRLPYEPGPTIPPDDRRPLDANALICAAVVLDVLTTRTTRLEEGPGILEELVEALVFLGNLGGFDEPAMERLLHYAQSRTGENRSALTRHVAHCMATIERLPEDVSEPTAIGGALASTPRSIAKALEKLDAAARVAVHEARLRLEAQQSIEYRQA